MGIHSGIACRLLSYPLPETPDCLTADFAFILNLSTVKTIYNLNRLMIFKQFDPCLFWCIPELKIIVMNL